MCLIDRSLICPLKKDGQGPALSTVQRDVEGASSSLMACENQASASTVIPPFVRPLEIRQQPEASGPSGTYAHLDSSFYPS